MSSELLLIVLFALYAGIYLLAVFDVIPPAWEEMSYAWFGFGCKVLMSMIFTAIRLSEHSQELGALVTRVTSLSSAFVSLLRSNFDFVVPCIADESGTCRLPANGLADLSELGRCLRRPVVGETLNSLLAGSADKQRFATYVQNALRRTDAGLALGACYRTSNLGPRGSTLCRSTRLQHSCVSTLPPSLAAETTAAPSGDLPTPTLTHQSPRRLMTAIA